MSDHPLIADLKTRMGGSMADDISEDQIVRDFAALGPATRADILLSISSADRDGSLRQAAQRMKLHCQLNALDYRLRRVAR